MGWIGVKHVCRMPEPSKIAFEEKHVWRCDGCGQMYVVERMGCNTFFWDQYFAHVTPYCKSEKPMGDMGT